MKLLAVICVCIGTTFMGALATLILWGFIAEMIQDGLAKTLSWLAVLALIGSWLWGARYLERISGE